MPKGVNGFEKSLFRSVEISIIFCTADGAVTGRKISSRFAVTSCTIECRKDFELI